jgi:hypothetical protein
VFATVSLSQYVCFDMMADLCHAFGVQSDAEPEMELEEEPQMAQRMQTLVRDW